MSVLENITHVLSVLASLLLPNTSPIKDRQNYERLPSMRMASRLSSLIIVILGVMTCISTNAEITSALESNDPVGGVRSGQRKLATSVIYNFACTGAVQTWYYFTLLCPILGLD